MRTNAKTVRILWCGAAVLFLLFVLLVVLLKTVDVAPIGPVGTEIGLSTLNRAAHDFFGVRLIWYDITDWLGLSAIAIAFVFFFLGAVQLCKRKSLFRVDHDILLLGVFYAAVIGAYLFFEFWPINYRPIILYKSPAPSFPSSHTMIVVFITGAAIDWCRRRIPSRAGAAVGALAAILSVTVAGRLVSGVHWLTDIIGGLLLAGALILAYAAACRTFEKKEG